MSGSFQPSFIRLLMISWMAGTVNAKSMCSQVLFLSMSQNIPSGLKYRSAIMPILRSVILAPFGVAI